jgi:hypothetical protein
MSNLTATAAPAKTYNGRQFKKRNCIIAGIGVLAGWAYLGFMSPITLLNGSYAKEECVRLATDNNKSKRIIKPMEMHAKNGKWVVELGYYDNEDDNSYWPRVCVVDSSTVKIVSLFESNLWR